MSMIRSQFDPKTDPDVGNLFSLLPDSDYLPTWYQLRTDPAMSAAAFTDPDVRSAGAGCCEQGSRAQRYAGESCSSMS